MGQVAQFVKPSPLDLYAAFYPQFTPSCFQQDMLEEAITDMTVWREVLNYWAGNDYRPQSIQKMIDYYNQLLAKKPTYRRAHVGKPEPIEAVNCVTCNDSKEIPRLKDGAKYEWDMEVVECPDCKVR